MDGIGIGMGLGWDWDGSPGGRGYRAPYGANKSKRLGQESKWKFVFLSEIPPIE